jgi:hypothetical protein
MGFEGNGQRFTGDDGFLKRGTYSTEIPGDGTTPLPVPAVYLVTAVAGTSSFPATALGGTAIAPGDFLDLKTGDAITPAVGDDVVLVTLEDQCDISSWGMEFTKEEIETTTLCDAVKVYRAGKADMSGTMNGIFTAGLSDAVDGNLREFIRIAKQDGDQSFDSFAQQESVLLGFFYINNDANLADRMYVIAPYQLFGNALGGEIGSPQSFTAPFRFASSSYTDSVNGQISISPTFYRLGDGT